jgi:hypothetical protein
MIALPTRLHARIDFGTALIAIVSPWLFGFHGSTLATAASVAAGVVVLAYSLLTDYELGIARSLQITLHLWCDGVVGLLLAISPWLLGFDQVAWVPHLVLGIALILLAFFSETVPGYERRQAGAARP